MKITLTYEIQVDYVIDLDQDKVESITVSKQTGSPLAGYDGFVHAASDTQPFHRCDVKDAVRIVKTTTHPKWKIKERTPHV